MKLINLEKAIEYAKEKDYIKTSNQERALREVFALATVEAVPIDALDKIKTEIKQLPYQRLFGKVSSYSLLDVVVEIIDKHIGEQNE